MKSKTRDRAGARVVLCAKRQAGWSEKECARAREKSHSKAKISASNGTAAIYMYIYTYGKQSR